MLFIAFYFIYSYVRLNDKRIEQEYFGGKTYVTLDGQTQLRFDDTAESALYISSEAKYALFVSYTENIFTMTDSETSINAIVIDEETLFTGTGEYLYYLKG